MSKLFIKEDSESPPSSPLESVKLNTVKEEHYQLPPVAALQYARPMQNSFTQNRVWRKPKDDNLKRVLSKEKAVKDGEEALKLMQNALNIHLFMNPSGKLRLDRITTVLNRKKTFQILVGFLGVTGAGKTTLINALIGYKNLLPSSAERACTAVVVEISYNASNDPQSLYRADIVYITRDEWREELERFFKDLQPPVINDDDQDDGTDSERLERIKETFDKLKCVYPRLKTLEELKSRSSEDLLLDDAVCNVLGKVVKVNCGRNSEFSDKIKNHIDSGDLDGTSAQWPLVKLVRVYVKSPFLEHGITLVDLPGNLDNNSARSAVAENYQKELSVTCILAEAKRGVSEKNAHDLLEKVTKRDLQLDGLYNSDSLCFVLTQTDRDFDISEYLKSHPDLKKKCASDQQKVLELNTRLKALSIEEKAAQEKNSENKRRVHEKSAEAKRFQAQLGVHPTNASSRSGKSGKRSADDTDTTSMVSQATHAQVEKRNELARVQKLVDDARKSHHKGSMKLSALARSLQSINRALFFARSRIRVACIQNRNKVATAALKGDYDETLAEMGREASSPLEVFCVAATVHLQYLRVDSSRQHPGFPNRTDTKIGMLRDWLVSTTFSTRESYAQAFLEDVEATIDSMMPWINDKYGDLKMSLDIREYWESEMKKNVAELQQDLAQLELSVSGELKQQVRTELYARIPEAERTAVAQTKNVVEHWASGMHWSTHRSVNRNHGDWKDSRKREHRWNATLVLELTEPLVAIWDKTFYRKFPAERDAYVTNGQKLIADFAEKFSDAGICPDVADGLGVLRDHILRTQQLLKSQTATTFEEVTKLIRKAHQTATPVIRQFLIPIYDKCALEKGAGHYGRNKVLHKKTMENKGLAMYQLGSKAIINNLDTMLLGLSPKFNGNHKAVLNQIREDIQLFFEQNSANGSRSSTRKAVSPEKVKLQVDLLAVVNKLAVAWKSEINIQIEQEVEDDDDDMPIDESEFFDVDKNNDQDDDYNPDSDLYD